MAASSVHYIFTVCRSKTFLKLRGRLRARPGPPAKQSKANQSKSKQIKAKQIKAKQSKAKQSKAKQSRAEQSRAEQSRAEQSTAGATPKMPPEHPNSLQKVLRRVKKRPQIDPKITLFQVLGGSWATPGTNDRKSEILQDILGAPRAQNEPQNQENLVQDRLFLRSFFHRFFEHLFYHIFLPFGAPRTSKMWPKRCPVVQNRRYHLFLKNHVFL